MAEGLINDEKLSVTSDLGSSCCDDTDMSSDVKDGNSDDVVSVAGSTSLTIDSLEEEDPKEQRCYEVPSAKMEQSVELNPNSQQKEQSAVDGCTHQCHVSEVVVHSENGSRDDVEPSQSKCSEKDIKVDDAHSFNKTEHKPEDKESTDTLRGSEEVPQKTDGSPSTSSNTKPQNLSENHEEKLAIRKSQSLTDESSTDPSPKLSRRSGIPRRKNSTQSMITVLSSSSNTPQNSPGRIRRSMTLDSGDCDPTPAGSRWIFTPSTGASPRSFPTSPVRVLSKLQRRASISQCECCSVSGVSCPPVALTRDNVTSRLRFEKSHRNHDQAEFLYLTPSQRKDLALKELRIQMKELGKQLDSKDKELEDLKKTVDDEKLQKRKELEEEVEEARAAAEAARKEVSSLQESHLESVKTVATLRQQLDDVKKDMRNKLAESEEIFLEMYNKGRQSAIFEHEEEMELKRKGGRTQEATEKELYHKLVRTQAELAKWQTIQRHESYHTMPVPGTEAETTLRFLKDSVFHFLTTDKTASDEHLRAIVRILHFSDVQREKIAQAIIMKRNKTGW